MSSLYSHTDFQSYTIVLKNLFMYELYRDQYCCMPHACSACQKMVSRGSKYGSKDGLEGPFLGDHISRDTPLS